MTRRTILLHLTWLCLALSCSESVPLPEKGNSDISGSGVLVTSASKLAPFHSIHTTGPITTVINQGPFQNLLVTADDNVIDRVQMEIRDQTLYLSLKEGQYHNIWVRIQVSLPAIKSINNDGNGSMKISQRLAHGPLLLINSGNGTIWIEGEGGDLYLQNDGKGTVSGFDFKTAHCIVNNSSGGSCELWCDQSLVGANSNGGTILYKGNARVRIDNPPQGTVLAADGPGA